MKCETYKVKFLIIAFLCIICKMKQMKKHNKWEIVIDTENNYVVAREEGDG